MAVRESKKFLMPGLVKTGPMPCGQNGRLISLVQKSLFVAGIQGLGSLKVSIGIFDNNTGGK